MGTDGMPKIVSAAEWQKAHEEFLAKEKAALRAQDQLAAERRRLPMVRIEKPYSFENPRGKATLLDLFEGRRQLILYHFMYHDDGDRFCVGCSMFADQISNLAHLHARDTSLVMVSRAPVASIERHRIRMGWKVPWYSSRASDFNFDFGVSTPDGKGETHGLSVFIRDEKNDVYRTYYTTDRGVEVLGTVWSLLDVTPWGRQEEWQDLPAGVPKTPPFEWWKFHDEYSR